MQGDIDEDTPVSSLSASDATKLHHLLQLARFDDPNGKHLSPAGEYNLRLGVIKELHPDLIATHQGDVRVLDGHAFIVEAAVSLGGRNIRPGLNIHRCATRSLRITFLQHLPMGFFLVGPLIMSALFDTFP
jgi:DNA topoisomerase VI subunit B